MSENEDGNEFLSMHMYIIWWIMGGIWLIVGPCIFFRRFRIICFRRIRQRKWNVETDDIALRSEIHGGDFRPRYPRDDSRHVVTKEGAEKSKREFLLKRLKDYTMIAYDVLNYNSEQTIEETDLVLRNAAEFGKVVSKDEEKRQSLFQKRFSLDGIANIMSKLDKKKGDAGVDLATSGKENNEDNLDATLSDRSHDSNYHNDVEAGLGNCNGNETENEQTEIANTACKIQDKDGKTSIRLLQLPLPGSKAPSAADYPAAIETDDLRVIFPECSVCLNNFKVGERISWSPEDDCDHVFHQDCIMQWFLTLSRRDDAKRRKRSYGVECKLHCPMCRQDFIASNTTFSDSEDGGGGDGTE